AGRHDCRRANVGVYQSAFAAGCDHLASVRQDDDSVATIGPGRVAGRTRPAPADLDFDLIAELEDGLEEPGGATSPTLTIARGRGSISAAAAAAPGVAE